MTPTKLVLGLSLSLAAFSMTAHAQEAPSCQVTEAKRQYAEQHSAIVKEVNEILNTSDPLEDLNFSQAVTNCIGSYGVSIGSIANLADAVINRVQKAAQDKCSEIKGYLSNQAGKIQGSFDAPFDLGTLKGGVSSGQGWGVNSQLDPEEYKKRAIEVWEKQEERLKRARDTIEGARSGYNDYDQRR